MKLRTAAVLGFAATLAAVAGAEPPAAPANTAPTSASAKAPAQQLAGLYTKFAGEWEGQQSITNFSGSSSASAVSVSNRIEQNGTAFATTFDGMAFGKVFEAAGRFTASGAAWFDNTTNNTFRFNAATEGSNTLTFSGQFTDSAGKSWKIEQVWTLKDANSFTAEFFRTGDSGSRESFAMYEMTRMAKGQRSSAFANFNNGKLWSNVRSTGTTQASVNESR